MNPRTLFRTITVIQNILLTISIGTLIVLPPAAAFEMITPDVRALLFEISHLSVGFVMIIRPLSNLFPRTRLLAQLVILRKGFGVLSAAVIVSFFLARYITDGLQSLREIFTAAYWSLRDYALLAHLGDLTAIILLITSNNFSKRILGRNWKRIQQLAYVYFYAGTGYAFFAFGKVSALVILILVTIILAAARIKKTHIARRAPKP